MVVSMIVSISPFPSVQRRHQAGPLLAEREQYLSHLLREGVNRKVVRCNAAYLLHIIRILQLNELRMVSEAEIDVAGKTWAEYTGPLRFRQYVPGAPGTFVRIAKLWLQFHGKLIPLPPCPFHDLIAKFSTAMRVDRGLAASSVIGYTERAQRFLIWFSQRNIAFSLVSIHDVDDYLAMRRMERRSLRGIAAHCQALRSFFGFAETQGWCRAGIPLGIKSPRIQKFDCVPKGPTWTEVRKILKTADGETPLQLRSKAILLLLSVYGLRSSEVAGLRLSDFDWRNEKLTVRRAKRGGIQHFPIQYEIGEAVLAYLQYGRPQCASRLVFVTAVRPHGPLPPSSIWVTVSKPMKALGINLPHRGPHALRHFCATRLLQKGCPLKEIAEFLGHRNTKTVSVYARFDELSLRRVAAFSLQGLE
jgi:integrase/recombinase XerD